jgi:hypothetical protein
LQATVKQANLLLPCSSTDLLACRGGTLRLSQVSASACVALRRVENPPEYREAAWDGMGPTITFFEEGKAVPSG